MIAWPLGLVALALWLAAPLGVLAWGAIEPTIRRPDVMFDAWQGYNCWSQLSYPHA